MSHPYGGRFHEQAVYESLQACGHDTKLHRLARLIQPERIRIGRGCIVDDFTVLFGGQGLTLGDRVHVSSFSSIVGGGRATLDSFAGLSAGCRLITGSEQYQGEGLTNPCIPDEFRAVERGTVILRKHALLFTNVIVFPDVTIGEGAVVAAGSIVAHDLDPWGIYRMKSDRLVRVRDRPRETILAMEAACIEKYGY